MATELTPLGKFVKWVVLPVACGLFGYAVVAPRLQHKVKISPELAPKLGIKLPPSEPEPTVEQPETGSVTPKPIRTKKSVEPKPIEVADTPSVQDAPPPTVDSPPSDPSVSNSDETLTVAPAPLKHKSVKKKKKKVAPPAEEAAPPVDPTEDPASGTAVGAG